MRFLSKLFGGGGGDSAGADAAPSAEPLDYKGYRITPQPISDGGQFRIAALIEAEVEGVTRQHHLVRADMLSDRDEAAEAAVHKARQVIDEQGPRLFE